MVTRDISIPQTVLELSPPAATNVTSATFAFSSPEPQASFECSLDGGAPPGPAFVPCVSPATYQNLGDDIHVFSVRAINAAGTRDPTPAAKVWRLDTVAPQTTLVAAPGATLTTPDATTTFSSNEAGSTFECRLNSAFFAACASPLTYNGLANGSYTLAIRAVDPAGNIDASPLAVAFQVNVPEPALVAEAPAAFTARVRKAGVKPGDHRTTVSWRRPKHRDYHHVEIVRAPGKKKSRRSLVYKGNKLAFVDKGLKNGVEYTWTLYAVNKNGTRSPGVKLMATAPVQIRLGKKTTVAPRTPLVLSWNPRKKARYYNVQLFRGKRNVLSSWPGGPVVSLTGTWNWEGAKRKLVAGKYEWFVWPGFGKRANSKFGNLIGTGKLVVKAPKAATPKKKAKKKKKK